MNSRGQHSRTFTIRADEEGKTIDIRISEPSGLKAENLSLATWGAALVLANILYRIQIIPPGTQKVVSSSGIDQNIPGLCTPSILELGAGTGLVGLTAALLWQADVVLTDLPEIVPALDANILINSESLQQSGVTVQCGTLDWKNPDHLRIHGRVNVEHGLMDEAKFPFVIVADTIYSEEHPELVTNAIANRLDRTGDARLLIIYPLRIAYLDLIRELWERLEGEGLISITEGREPADPNTDEEAPFEWSIWSWKAL